MNEAVIYFMLISYWNPAPLSGSFHFWRDSVFDQEQGRCIILHSDFLVWRASCLVCGIGLISKWRERQTDNGPEIEFRSFGAKFPVGRQRTSCVRRCLFTWLPPSLCIYLMIHCCPVQAADPELLLLQTIDVATPIYSLHLSPDDRYVYARFYDGLGIYRRDPSSGQLEFVQYLDGGSLFGDVNDLYLPDNMVISPEGRQLYVTGSPYTVLQGELEGIKEVGPTEFLAVFSVDAASGILSRSQLIHHPGREFSSMIIPGDGKHLYVKSVFITEQDDTDSGVTVFSREPQAGLLSLNRQILFSEVIGEGSTGLNSERFSPDGTYLYMSGGTWIDRMNTKSLVVFARNLNSGDLQLVQSFWESDGFPTQIRIIDFPQDPGQIYFITHYLYPCAGYVQVSDRNPDTGLVDIASLRYLGSQLPDQPDLNCQSNQTIINSAGTLAQVYGGAVSFPYRREPATGALTPLFQTNTLIASRDGFYVYSRFRDQAPFAEEELHVYALDSDGDGVIDSSELDMGRNPLVHEPTVLLILNALEE